MKANKRLTDAEIRLKALSRWEGEGGALAPSRDESEDEPKPESVAPLGARFADA